VGEKFLKSVNVWHSYKQERDCLVHFLRLLAVCWPGAHGMVMSLWRRPRFFGPPCISKPFLSSNGFQRFCVHDNYRSKSDAKAPRQTIFLKIFGRISTLTKLGIVMALAEFNIPFMRLQNVSHPTCFADEGAD